MTPADLRRIRGALGLTQQQLATALGLDGDAGRVTVTRWETGSEVIGRPTMLRLALERLAIRRRIPMSHLWPKEETK